MEPQRTEGSRLEHDSCRLATLAIMPLAVPRNRRQPGDHQSNGFLADFNRARANFFLTGDPACVSAGCQTLTFFPNLQGGGFLDAGIVQQDLQEGIIGDLADLYRTNGIVNNDGTDPFAPNPFLRGADLLENGSSSNWNAGIVELRRRFGNGLYFQANYAFSKALTDYSGDTNNDQSRFLPLLDNAQPNLERSRAQFRHHTGVQS